jgi:hypothetical protein
MPVRRMAMASIACGRNQCRDAGQSCSGSIILVNIGCSETTSVAETNSTAANSGNGRPEAKVAAEPARVDSPLHMIDIRSRLAKAPMVTSQVEDRVNHRDRDVSTHPGHRQAP